MGVVVQSTGSVGNGSGSAGHSRFCLDFSFQHRLEWEKSVILKITRSKDLWKINFFWDDAENAKNNANILKNIFFGFLLYFAIFRFFSKILLKKRIKNEVTTVLKNLWPQTSSPLYFFFLKLIISLNSYDYPNVRSISSKGLNTDKRWCIAHTYEFYFWKRRGVRHGPLHQSTPKLIQHQISIFSNQISLLSLTLRQSQQKF